MTDRWVQNAIVLEVLRAGKSDLDSAGEKTSDRNSRRRAAHKFVWCASEAVMAQHRHQSEWAELRNITSSFMRRLSIFRITPTSAFSMVFRRHRISDKQLQPRVREGWRLARASISE